MSAKFYKNLTREEVIERLTAQDVSFILRAADDGDYAFLGDVIQGNGFTQYNNLTPDALMAEYGEREDSIEADIEDGNLPYEVV
jgi:hypothetical protein